MAKKLMEIRNLKTYFRTKNAVIRAVDGIDLEIDEGQIVCIVGESGSGKSITSLSIMQLLPKPGGNIVEGEVRFEGVDLTKLSDKKMADIRGDRISMIFQEPMTALNPVMKVGEQIAEVLLRHRHLSRKEAHMKAVDMLQFVGVPRPEQIVKEYPHQLSGGMRQRVMIAMAMVCEPKLLIADEPTTALDVTIQIQVLELMKKMRDELNTSIILITHDLGVVAEMADHVVVMYAGQVVENVHADVIFEMPLHPYTKALLASIPLLEDEKDVLYSIPGTVPSAAAFPPGCRFADRCDSVQSACKEKLPELREVRPGHFVRCILVEKGVEA
ncbi:ABC transporter ATP-binding protein [Paenibacillus sp. 19GGS1-52]|uniref:ABC transporter ATP-binding protein n=1 Tax=Paenibacillus sp. 19GGS1-52 TaxID=2758563 RepID=UPI001EFC1FBA|nr:ABC transporter ATP-binding protein [Paenibacillus sp. 19GGS1-52]ULO09060.1 ABC transporter ATP-binding protein [Paenibacillus sp. 19GGS1-52]